MYGVDTASVDAAELLRERAAIDEFSEEELKAAGGWKDISVADVRSVSFRLWIWVFRFALQIQCRGQA